jgi:hypothetical protein
MERSSFCEAKQVEIQNLASSRVYLNEVKLEKEFEIQECRFELTVSEP